MLHDLYASRNVIRVIISRRIRRGGHVARERREMRTIFSLENVKGKRPLERPRHSWEYIRMDLREIGLDAVDGMHLAQDGDQWEGPYEHGTEPFGSIKGRELLD
jgi:hypothetical protein